MALRKRLEICFWFLYWIFFVSFAICICIQEKTFSTALSAAGIILTAGAAIAGLIIALFQVRVHNSIRVFECIKDIYDSFLDEDKKDNSETLMDFFERIRKGKEGDIDRKKDEKNLNQAISLFDEVNVLLRQGLLYRNSEAWEYVASEIQYFALCDEVWKYMEERLIACRENKFPLNIIPFTGFTELFRKMPEQYRANPYMNIPMSYKSIYNELNEAQNSRFFWRRIFSPKWDNIK